MKGLRDERSHHSLRSALAALKPITVAASPQIGWQCQGQPLLCRGCRAWAAVLTHTPPSVALVPADVDLAPCGSGARSKRIASSRPAFCTSLKKLDSQSFLLRGACMLPGEPSFSSSDCTSYLFPGPCQARQSMCPPQLSYRAVTDITALLSCAWTLLVNLELWEVEWLHCTCA